MHDLDETPSVSPLEATTRKISGKPNIEPLLYGTPEAAVALGVSERLLLDWRSQGRGPECFRVDGSKGYKYPVAGLHRWIESEVSKSRLTVDPADAAEQGDPQT